MSDRGVEPEVCNQPPTPKVRNPMPRILVADKIAEAGL